jgi:hypothetical protein
VVTFSATPTVSGMNTLHVIVTAGSGLATEYMTYNGTLTVVEGPVNGTWDFASTKRRTWRRWKVDTVLEADAPEISGSHIFVRGA